MATDFCLVFRRFSGTTPMAYRRRCKYPAQGVEPLCAFPATMSGAPRTG
jgi:hypothetical protein